MAHDRLLLACSFLTLITVGLAGCTTPTPPDGGNGGTGTGKMELKIGTVLPATGDLNAYGPPGQRAVDLLRDTWNGIADAKTRITTRHQDSQTQAAAGAAAATTLRTDGATAIIGAYASGVSKAVLEVTGPNKLVQISPASTSPELTELMRNRPAADRYFFRTSPSDALQGPVAAQLAADMGWTNVVVIVLNNPYGNGLGSTFKNAFDRASAGTGGVEARTARVVAVEEKQTSYSSVLEQAFAGCTSATAAACPDGVFFVGYPDTGTQVMKDWWAQTAWRGIPWIFSEGVQTQSFFTGLIQQGIRVQGFEGTAPVGVGPGFEAFKAMMGREPTLFQAHAFDAAAIIALAAEKAGSTSGTAIRDAIRSVAGAPGTKVGPNELARAVQLLRDGQDIDYEGAAGGQNFNEFGDVTSAYEVYVIGEDGTIGRKCLVPEADVVRTPVRLPAACTEGMMMDEPDDPMMPSAMTWSLEESGGAGAAPWSIQPATSNVAAGMAFSVNVSNPAGNAARHNLTLIMGTDGAVVAKHDPELAPGASAVMDVMALEAGTYTYYCSVVGHRSLGMVGTLTVA